MFVGEWGSAGVSNQRYSYLLHFFLEEKRPRFLVSVVTKLHGGQYRRSQQIQQSASVKIANDS
jgi:hypothetical protein